MSQQPLKRFDFFVLAIVGTMSGLLLRMVFMENPVLEAFRWLFIAFILSFFTGFILLWRRDKILSRFGLILGLAMLLTGFTWINIHNAAHESDTPLLFWALVGGPLLGFLVSAFARASFNHGNLFWPYKALWRSGSSILADTAIAGVVCGATIGFVLLWSFAFKAFGMQAAAKMTSNTYFLVPLGGAAAAMAAGLARSNVRLGETVRSILLIGCRIGLPLAAIFCVIFAIGLISGGSASLEKVPLTPAGLLLALALASELIFNGVYQDGAKTPPNWLRISAWVTLATLPVFTISAVVALWARVDAYGLTPPRMIALIALTLTAIYTILLLAGLFSELFKNHGATNGAWMPPIAKLNTFMAMVWILTLVLIHTPLLDPTGVSAHHQLGRLLNGKIAAEDFDFGYLRFKLGKTGARAFASLERSEDPEILSGVQRAKAAENYWNYKSETQTPIAAPDSVFEPDTVLENEQAALAQVNDILAGFDLNMQDPASFDYGALVHATDGVSTAALNALTDWARETKIDESGPMHILREQITQGIIAAHQTSTLEEWEATRITARIFREDFENRVQDDFGANFMAARLGEIAAKDRRARALYEQVSKDHENIPLPQALLELLHAKAVIQTMDKAHLKIVKDLLGENAWFDPDDIDKPAEADAWLIVMHADHDPAFQSAVLAAVEPRALSGDFDGRLYARLFDKRALAKGQRQRYGTKTVCENGRWVADITEDPDNVDKRRAQMGLMPLARALVQERTRFGACDR